MRERVPRRSRDGFWDLSLGLEENYLKFTWFMEYRIWFPSISPIHSYRKGKQEKKKENMLPVRFTFLVFIYSHIYVYIYIYIYIYNHRCLYTEYMVYNIMYNVYCMKKHMDTRESGTRKSPTKSKGKEEPWKWRREKSPTGSYRVENPREHLPKYLSTYLGMCTYIKPLKGSGTFSWG